MCSPSVVTHTVTLRGLPDLRPVVVRVTSRSLAAAAMGSMSYDPRAMRRLSLVIGAVGLAGLISASFLIYMGGARGSFRLLSAIVPAGRAARAPIDNAGHLYVLDGFGGLHPVGSSPVLSASASWPNKDIAFSLALFPVGGAAVVDSGVYWPHWIGAREIVMAPWSSAASPAGYLLDADGGIHGFGGAPGVVGNATWPGAGTARGLVLTPDGTPASVRGYTLDGFGGVHPFGGARPVLDAASFSGDVARGIALIPSHGLEPQGYTLDYSGGIHPFGGAPAVSGLALGKDEADSLVAWSVAPLGAPGGWVLDRDGEVRAWGSAPSLAASRTWPGWDIARGMAGAGSGGGSTERT